MQIVLFGVLPLRLPHGREGGCDVAALPGEADRMVQPGPLGSDVDAAVYEVHMKKADGSLVTVKFGTNLTVTKVESGTGAGDPAPAATARREQLRELAGVRRQEVAPRGEREAGRGRRDGHPFGLAW